MNLRYVILYVPDVPTALSFYEAAFGAERGFVHEAHDYGELRTGSTTLAFSSVALMQQLGKSPDAHDPRRPSFELALEVEDVPAALARALDAGATLVSPVQRQPWGQTLAYVSTPDGALIELCSPVAQPG